MPVAKRKPTFADYGRLGGLKGGKSTSDAKVAAARKNGQKGGWPKGKRRKDDVAKARRQYVADVISPMVATLAKDTPRKGKGKR